MKINRFARKLTVILIPTALVLGAAMAFAAQWVNLGSKKVSDRMDHDVIHVGPQRGEFSGIKFAVRGHAVHFKRVVVQFKNGHREAIDLRDVIPAGGETRRIDLPGSDRTIKSIEFWYEAETIGHAGAHVAAFGVR